MFYLCESYDVSPHMYGRSSYINFDLWIFSPFIMSISRFAQLRRKKLLANIFCLHKEFNSTQKCIPHTNTYTQRRRRCLFDMILIFMDHIKSISVRKKKLLSNFQFSFEIFSYADRNTLMFVYILFTKG